MLPKAELSQGVWATLEITLQGATLRIYDTAPDAPHRTYLAKHPFPLKEQVHPLRPELQRSGARWSMKRWITDVSHRLVEQVRSRWPFYDVLMARLVVKVPRFSSMP